MAVQKINVVIQSLMQSGRIEVNTGCQLLLCVPAPETVAARHRLDQLLVVLTYLKEHVRSDAQGQVATMLASLTVPQNERAVTYQSNVLRSPVRRFLLEGPFCHRKLMSGQTVSRKNGKFAGQVYGYPNKSVVDAAEVSDRVKGCWNPASRSAYGSFGADKQWRKMISQFFNDPNQVDDDFEEKFSYPLLVLLVNHFSLDKLNATQGALVNKILGFYLFMCESPDIRNHLKKEGWYILLHPNFGSYVQRYLQSFPVKTRKKTLQNITTSICGSRVDTTACLMSTIASVMTPQNQTDIRACQLTLKAAAWRRAIRLDVKTQAMHRPAETNMSMLVLVRLWVKVQRFVTQQTTDLLKRLKHVLANARLESRIRDATYNRLQGLLLFIMTTSNSMGCFRAGELHGLIVVKADHGALPSHIDQGLAYYANPNSDKAFAYQFTARARRLKVSTAGLGPPGGYVWPPAVSKLMRYMLRLNCLVCKRQWGKKWAPKGRIYLFPDMKATTPESINRRQAQVAIRAVCAFLPQGLKLRHAACTFNGWVMKTLLGKGRHDTIWWRVREMLAVLMRHTLVEELASYDKSGQAAALKKAWAARQSLDHSSHKRRFIDLQIAQPLYFKQARWVGRVLRHCSCVSEKEAAQMFPCQMGPQKQEPDILEFCSPANIEQLRQNVRKVCVLGSE